MAVRPSIRAYDDSDLEALADLYSAAVHELGAPHYDAAQREAWAPRPPDLAEWRRRLAWLKTLVAELEGGPVGFISYGEDGHIALLFVAPGCARRGVASELYARAESALAAAGCRSLTTEASLVARPFFERKGFRVAEEQRVPRNGVALRRYLMRKDAGAGPGRRLTPGTGDWADTGA